MNRGHHRHLSDPWHGRCGNSSVDITANKINEWMQLERRRKIRADRRGHLFGRVRSIFIFLFVAAIFVFAFNRHAEIQTLASGQFSHLVKKSAATSGLRQKALHYEQEINEITK
jgi:hypothetical protein